VQLVLRAGSFVQVDCAHECRFLPASDTALHGFWLGELPSAGRDRLIQPAPDCNAYAERFVLSIKSECLHRMIFFGESSLRRAIQTYLDHYHVERAHQGIGNAVIQREERVAEGEVNCRERLGGLLKHYYRAA